MKLQLVTFNVNGLRSIKDYYAHSKLNNFPSFNEFLDSFSADIICFQEHKTNVAAKLSHDLSYPKGYSAFYAFPRVPKKIGYSGVVTFVKQDSPWLPIAWYDGFSGLNDKKRVPLHESPLLNSTFSPSELAELDSEGRCIITDHFHFLLLNIYFPNDSGPERSEYREKFYKAVHLRCLDLIKEHGKELIILGDINITYHPLDHCEYSNPFKSINFDIKKYLEEGDVSRCDLSEILKEFYSNPMRKWLADLVYCQQIWRDCFRSLHENAIEKYTCWNTQMSARGSNYGTRIDTIFTSGMSELNLEACDIMPKVMGSDHCPVAASFTCPDSFYEIQMEVLKDCKLANGNIPRTFGKLDSFFAVSSKKRLAIDIEGQAEFVNIETPETEELEVKAKTKISDFFHVTRKSKVESTVILETDDTDITQVNSAPETIIDAPVQRTELVNLFNRAVTVPKCRHNEPCKLLKVKKAGPNKNRSFYCCARSAGSASDPEARCDFFEWLNKSSNTNNKD